MNKKIIASISSAVLLLVMSTTVFAAPFSEGKNANQKVNQNSNQSYNYRGCGNGYMNHRGCGNGHMNQCYNLMKDSKGNIVDKDTFKLNLENAIDNGDINSKDKEYFLNMYDYCLENNNNQGSRRGCCNYNR